MSDQPEKKAHKPRDASKEPSGVKMMLRLPQPVFDALTRSGAKWDLDARALLENNAISSARGADIPLKLADYMEPPKAEKSAGADAEQAEMPLA